MKTSHKAFSIVEIILVVVVVGIIGLVGFKFWNTSQNKQANTPATTSDVASVKKAADLDTVDKQLDNVDVSGSFESDLDSAGSF
jgi:type II secretory pathway pseudopilin PulG